ncbi:MAG: pilus assembly protein PilZ [Proteobacteria bacterium]|nr:MAG: pilus assembly protein PilZ [Pseudomonadota bacterium]PIE19316.1 MAG: pilus assembly protein PilZ [Pseudomonadota bacterium]
MSERRATHRFTTHVPVKVDSATHGISYCIARNVSESGIFLETREPLPIGSIVEVWFEAVGNATPIIARGEVKHHFFLHYNGETRTKALTGMGVRFTRFDALEQEELPEWAFGVAPTPLH